MGTTQSCSSFSLLRQDKEAKGCQAWWMKKIIPCALSVPTSLWAHAIHQHKRRRMCWITCQQAVSVVNTSLLSGLLWHCHKKASAAEDISRASVAVADIYAFTAARDKEARSLLSWTKKAPLRRTKEADLHVERGSRIWHCQLPISENIPRP